ncbi:MAG TPA: HAD hydrolase-like protein [Stellaceae bacterium]|jgi:phosphoglycolate phosphatase|nr:HAD hydrolase-like protein [Stellaceae bacterium]
MSRPRAVLFDWDNTLVDSWDTIHDALGYCFTEMGREPWSLAEVKARTRLSLAEAFPPIFGERWQEARDHYFNRFHAVHLERIKPLPGVLAMLEGLAELDMPLAVVSNKTGATLRKEAAHFGWTSRFAKLVGAGDASADKPAAAPILLALEAARLTSGADIWYVGDTALDMQCAANAGCHGVLLHTDAAGDPDFERFLPALRFGDCATLIGHIKAL